MKIHAYFLCKNEEMILPHLLNHYSQFCEKITFFDNESTDNSRSIINDFDKCKTVIVDNKTNGVIRDDIYLDIKNNCWKADNVDLVIVADADEFLYHPDLINFLSENKYDVYYPTGYNMISAHFPMDYDKLLVDQVRYGAYDPGYSKSIIFNPQTLQDINFTPGCHHSSPVSKNSYELSIYKGQDLKLLHYKNLSFDYRYNKNSLYGATLSDINKKFGYGFHYNFSYDEQYKEFDSLYKSKKLVINNNLPKVSFTITTCNRLDLLEQTLNSFFELCKFPFHEYIMIDDSGDDSVYNQLQIQWGYKFKIIQNNPKIGLSKSLDKLFNECNSEYIFHCEDDWLFDSNPSIIEDSLSVLQEYSYIHQVHIRHIYDNPHKAEEQLYSTLNFVNFRKLPWWRNEWTGYSWNPGLRRKSDYQIMFPNGIQEFGDEIECSKHSMKFDYLAVLLENTSCKHIGYDRHTENFII
jgi:hypothetical protein